MNGHIISAPNVVRIPYGSARTIQVIAACDTASIPPDSFAYIYEGITQNIGAYQTSGSYAIAAITLNNENETDSTITVQEIVYSFWNGNIADDNREITIIYEARRKGGAV
jgi:hypothetical protein